MGVAEHIAELGDRLFNGGFTDLIKKYHELIFDYKNQMLEQVSNVIQYLF